MHPILFTLGGFPVATYGLLTALGVFFAAALAMRLGRRAGFDEAATLDVVLVAVLGAIAGGKALYILTVFPDFLRDPLGHVFARQGFVFLGGLIGSVALCAWHVRRRGLSFWALADVFAPVIPLGHAFGRVGCHMTGCCYGGVCAADAWYGVRYPLTVGPDGTVFGGFAYLDHLGVGLIDAGADRSLAVYPVQLAEAGLLVALSLALLWLFARGRTWPGRVFLAYLIGYAALRFTLEGWRGDAARGVTELGGLALSTSRALSIAIALAAGAAWWAGRSGRLPGQQVAPVAGTPPASGAMSPAPSRSERRRAGRVKGGSSRR